jgi:hypothetical protein
VLEISSAASGCTARRWNVSSHFHVALLHRRGKAVIDVIEAGIKLAYKHFNRQTSGFVQIRVYRAQTSR